jgi:hypothetical protein
MRPGSNSGFPLLPGERKVRFGCGATVGVLAGFFGAARRIQGVTWVELTISMVVTALLFGLFAAYGGDRFWRHIRWWT